MRRHLNLLGVGLISCLMAFPVVAADMKAVVVDHNQKTVINTWKNCVITQWDADTRECGGDKVARPVPVAPVVNQQSPVSDSYTIQERTVYFDFNKSELGPYGRNRLKVLLQKLSADSSVKSLSIIGYADRIGSDAYNYELSQKRAQTVENYIVANSPIPVSNVSVEWLGESKPQTQCSDGLAKNELIQCLKSDRRVEVVIEYK